MQDKVVVITGSTSGFGRAIAEAMLRAGATVVVSGRSKAPLQKAVQALRPLGTVVGFLCDVRREHQVYALARQAVRKFGRIDIWINNAGFSASAGRIIDTPPAQVIDMFHANDMGTLHGTRAALHYMLPRKAGTLVNIYGAGSFLRPASPTALYGATKAWVASFTRSLSKELAGSGLQLVGFSPGMLLTDMLSSPTVLGDPGREMMKNYAFVLRLLASSPQKAAERLVRSLASNHRPFTEVRRFKPWMPLLGLVRIGWENLTHTGSRPRFQFRVLPPYRPNI
jgi:NAD(P)-dependent dehydrogenase (short-subunit alcohol dehydrogenase family)